MVFLKLFQGLLYDFYIWLTEVFSINQNVIKDMKLFSKDLIDITLKTSGYIRKTKKYNLILKIAIFGVKSCLLFIIFSDFYLILGTSQVQLYKLLGPA